MFLRAREEERHILYINMARHRKMVVKNYSDIPRFELNGRYYTITYVYMN